MTRDGSRRRERPRREAAGARPFADAHALSRDVNRDPLHGEDERCISQRSRETLRTVCTILRARELLLWSS